MAFVQYQSHGTILALADTMISACFGMRVHFVLGQVCIGGSMSGASCSQVQGSQPGKYLYVLSGLVPSRCLQAVINAGHILSHNT